MIAQWVPGIAIFLLVSLEILGYSYLFSKISERFKNFSILFALFFLNLFSFLLTQVALSVRNNSLAQLCCMVLGCFCFFILKPKNPARDKMRNPKFFSPLFWRTNVFWILPIFFWFMLKSIDLLIPHFQHPEISRILSHSKQILLYRNNPVLFSLSEKFANVPFFEMIFVHILSLSHFFGASFLKVHFRGLIAVQLFFLFWGVGLVLYSIGKLLRINLHHPVLYCMIWFLSAFLPERWWLYILLFFISTVLTTRIPDYTQFWHGLQRRASHLKPEYKVFLSLILLFSTQPHAHVIWQHLKYANTTLQTFLVSRQESFQAIEWINQNFNTDDSVLSSFNSPESAYYSKPYMLYSGDSQVLAENLKSLEYPAQKRDVFCDFGFSGFLNEEQHTEPNLSGLTLWLLTKKDTRIWKSREYSLFDLFCDEAVL